MQPHWNARFLSEGTIPELGYVSQTRTRVLLDLPQLHDELSKLLLAGTATASCTNQSKLATTTVEGCILPEVLDGNSKGYFFFSRKCAPRTEFVDDRTQNNCTRSRRVEPRVVPWRRRWRANSDKTLMSVLFCGCGIQHDRLLYISSFCAPAKGATIHKSNKRTLPEVLQYTQTHAHTHTHT